MQRKPRCIQERSSQSTVTGGQDVPTDAAEKKGRARRGVKNNTSQPGLSDRQSVAESSESQAAAAEGSVNGRRRDGRFALGNRGGPGNPHARHCARMLTLFRNAISDKQMVLLFQVLFEKAVGGDVGAAKLVLAYHIGKPPAAPDPDAIDRDEWEHHKQDALAPEEMKLVLSSLPTRVGNDIARTALPVMTDAWTKDLAAKLMDRCPNRPEGPGTSEDAVEIPAHEAPIANGELGDTCRTQQTRSDSSSSATLPVSSAKKAAARRIRRAGVGRSAASVRPAANEELDEAATAAKPGAVGRQRGVKEPEDT